MRANDWLTSLGRAPVRDTTATPSAAEPAALREAATNAAALLTGPRRRQAKPTAPLTVDDGTAQADLISALYQDHALALVRTAKLLVRDQQSAEDVVHEAFLGLCRALPRLSNQDQILPYLRAAVINRSRSVLRARQRALLRRVQHEPPASSAESAALAGEDRRQVLTAVGRLPRRSREVLVLRYYLDLPDQEIAAALGISRGTVSSTASRALAAVARELKEDL
jgi:RNA polymerase sigma-70 factor (sigma-E family)